MKTNVRGVTMLLSLVFSFSTFPTQAAVYRRSMNTGGVQQPTALQTGLTVTRSDDRNSGTCVPGDCSLREAVYAANDVASDDTINFAVGLTKITLTAEIIMSNSGALTIDGPGANVLTIDGGPGTNRIFYIDRANVTVSGVTLTDGNGNGTGSSGSGAGGAIYVHGDYWIANGSLNLDGVNVTGNGGDGGGVLLEGAGNHRIINSTISGNSADTLGYGGGVYYSGSYYGTLAIVNSTISDNSAGYGAGLVADCGGTTTIRNSTITDNHAGVVGGGIYQITDNDYNCEGRFSIGNTVVAGNTGSSGPRAPEIYSEVNGAFNFITSAGGNLVGNLPGNAASTGFFPSGMVFQSSDILDVDPKLGALQNNGGSMPTHSPLAGSPLIDKGLNSLVDPSASAFDQRGAGFARVRDGNGDGLPVVDIGASELQSGAIGIVLASINGRVSAPDGSGLRNASVTLTDSQGVAQTVTTSSFGFYSFDNVATGSTYTLAVSSRRYRYASRSLTLNSGLTNVDFVGLE